MSDATNESRPQSIFLRCCEPATNTDKDYRIELIAVEGGFGVQVFWGKHGSVLKPTMKTNRPLAREDAQKEFDKILRGQLSKGYKVENSGGDAMPTAFVEKVASGIHPQLLNPIGDKDAERYITDRAWAMEWKNNGERLLLDIQADGTVRALNRKGQVVPGPAALMAAAAAAKRDILLDGEYLRATDNNAALLVAFDILRLDGVDLSSHPFSQRRIALVTTLDDISPAVGDHIERIFTCFSEDEKRRLLDKVMEEGGEGVVFKRLDAPVTVGKNHTDQVKLKFWNDCSAVVTRHNLRRSVELGVYDGGILVDIGNVTIPPNAEVPAVGEVVDVEYLYAYEGGALFQPKFRGKRTDVATEECTKAALVFFKPESVSHRP